MKRKIIILCYGITSLFVSCGKNDPTPSGGSGNNNPGTGTTTGTTTGTSSGTGNTGTGTATGTTLSITDFSPKSAKPASNITITGTGFGSDTSQVKLLIGNLPYYQLVSVSPTSIVFQTNLATPNGKISVIVNGKTATSTADFTALPQDLKIIGFTGYYGQLGSSQLGHQMYIYADGFGTDTNKIFISFNGTTPVKCNYIGPSKSQIGTVVPRYAQAGKVTLTVNGQSVTSTVDFNLDMSLRDYSPKSFSSGDTVKITGVAFTNASDMSVNFNDNKATRPIMVTATELHVVVPLDAKSGYLTVSANLGQITDFTPDKFTFVPTVYFNYVFTPASGKVGDLIRINGDFVGADIATLGVSFGGSSPVQPASINGPDIYVKVPSDAKTGAISITRTGYKPFTGPFIFTVLQ
jgi:hypothetical protein